MPPARPPPWPAWSTGWPCRCITTAAWRPWSGWLVRPTKLARFPLALGAWSSRVDQAPAEAQRWLSLAEGATSVIPLSDAPIRALVLSCVRSLMPDGVERALADAHPGGRAVRPGKSLATGALLIQGVAHALLGATDLARADLAAVDLGTYEDAFTAQRLAAPRRAAGCLGRGRGTPFGLKLDVEETGLGHYAGRHRACGGGTRRPSRRTAGRCPRDIVARPPPAAPARPRPPWLSIQVGLELTRAHLALGEAAAARTVLTETEQVLERRPHVGSLAQEVRELRERVAATSRSVRTMSLTAAELRLLPYLATHLTFLEIGQRLYLSQHGQERGDLHLPQAQRFPARSDVERAIQVGLLESTIYPPQPNRRLKA